MAPILKSTLVVARQKLLTYSESTRFGKLFLGTIEPAEPMNKDEILVLMEKVLDLSKEDVSQFEGNNDKFWEYVNKLAFAPKEDLGEYDRHRVAYFLRDKIEVEKDQNAVKVLENFLRQENREVTSALLRHEIGFIFGQIYQQAMSSGSFLEAVAEDETESPIVRHEVIMSLENITGSLEKVKQFLTNSDQ